MELGRASGPRAPTPSLDVVTAPARPSYAALDTRMLAGLLDIIILSVISSIFSFGFERAAPLVSFIFGCGYACVLWSRFGGGQTVGMQLARIRLVDRQGCVPSLGCTFRRMLGLLISVLALGQGLRAASKDPQRRAWHDRWAGTYVLNTDRSDTSV